jgi:hypothetical protein
VASQLTIELPRESPAAEVEAFQVELRQLADIKGAGLYAPKGIGPEEILIWVKLIGAVVPLVVQVVDMLRKRGIEKATITLPNGSKIEVDKAMAEEIERLMAAARATSEGLPQR